jgi:hypothetical protein
MGHSSPKSNPFTSVVLLGAREGDVPKLREESRSISEFALVLQENEHLSQFQKPIIGINPNAIARMSRSTQGGAQTELLVSRQLVPVSE